MSYDEDPKSSIAEWRAARNRVLRDLDVEEAKLMLGPAAERAGDEVILMSLHKGRYDCVDMPDELRHESAAWLRERGYSGAFGPLLPPGELPRRSLS